MKFPEWMRWIESENRYSYMDHEDSVQLDKAIASDQEDVAVLLIRIASSCHAAHCASKY